MAYKHIVHRLDGQCGCEMLVFDREKSAAVKAWQVNSRRNAAEEMNRRFIDSGEVKDCPSCHCAFDLNMNPLKTLEAMLPGSWCYPGPVSWEERKNILLTCMQHRLLLGSG